MKKLLVLAGGSARNLAWGEACVAAYRPQFDEVFFQTYDHWTTGEPNLDFVSELEKVSKTVKGAGTEGEWYIMAKSIGSILATKAMAEKRIAPTACVFFGMPINLVVDTVLAGDLSVLTALTMPVVAFHNEHDPTALYEVAQSALTKYAPGVTVVTRPGNTHDYVDFADYLPQFSHLLA